MRLGMFPLWARAKESDLAKLQIEGTDVLLVGEWRIQVKCDFYAGDGSHPSATGNLFLQTAELNPFKHK